MSSKKSAPKRVRVTNNSNNPVIKFSAQHWKSCRNDVTMMKRKTDDPEIGLMQLHCDACGKGMMLEAPHSTLDMLVSQMKMSPVQVH